MEFAKEQAKGVCSVTSPSSACADQCDNIQICASLKKGECFFPLETSPFTEELYPSVMVAVKRLVIVYNLKISNCTGNNVKITETHMDLHNRLLLVNDQSQKEYFVDRIIMSPDSPAEWPFPTARILSLKTDCGMKNDLFGAGFVSVPDGVITSTEIFDGYANIPPGDCCIEVVIAIDQPGDDDTDYKSLLVDRACFQIKGILMSGEACCKFTKSLILPGDCMLRTERLTIPADCSQPILTEDFIIPPFPLTNPLTNVWYVTADASNLGTGTSWASPMTLTNALANSARGEIWMKQGVYTPSIGTPFTISRIVTIFGGFKGTETARDQRIADALTNGTFLDGLGNRQVMEITQVLGMTTANTCLDGVTVRNGYRSVNSDGGAGIRFVVGATLLIGITIKNSLLEKNVSVGISGSYTRGAAILLTNSNLNMVNVFFVNNKCFASSANGAAIFSIGMISPEYITSVVGVNVVFRGNECHSQSDVTNPNSVSNGGAVLLFRSNAALANCLFADNVITSIANGAGISDSEGAAIYYVAGAGAGAGRTDVVLTNCTFNNNRASATGSNNFNRAIGGIMYDGNNADSSTLQIDNCIIWNNQATADPSTNPNGRSTNELDFNPFVGSNHFLTVRDTLIKDPTISTSVFVPIANALLFSVYIQNVLQTGTLAARLATIKALDPLFVNPPADLHLTKLSPAIDMGYNPSLGSTVSLLPSPFITPLMVDLDMHFRIYNSVVDMGAYEFTPCLVDNVDFPSFDFPFDFPSF